MLTRNSAIIFFIIIFLLSCLAENNLKIVCDIHTSYYKYVDEGRDLVTCSDINSEINADRPNMELSDVVNSNGSPVTNLNEIEALSFWSPKNMKYIPNGIKRKFPNLKAISFHESSLTSIENIKQFGSDLQSIKFYMIYRITTLQADLFEFNPKLKMIDFYRCSIKFIDPTFFTNLKNLMQIKKASFEKSGCIDQEFDVSNGVNMQTFKWNNEKCKDPNLFHLEIKIEGEKNPLNLKGRTKEELMKELKTTKNQFCEKMKKKL